MHATASGDWGSADYPKNILGCADHGDVLNYRRFRELMPPVGLYSESRPDRTRF